MRAASKNFRDVLIVVSPNDYDAVIAELDHAGRPDPGVPVRPLARAFEHRRLRHRDCRNAGRGHADRHLARVRG